MKIIITDPCYVNSENEEFYEDVLEEFEVGREPTTLLSVSYQALISETGFGDWGNEVYTASPLFKIETNSFGADSGLVTLMLVDDDFDNSDGAVIKIDDAVDINAITFKMNRFNEGWTVVEVYYQDNLVLQSMNNAFIFDDIVGFEQTRSLAGFLQGMTDRYSRYVRGSSNWHEVSESDDLWHNNVSINESEVDKDVKVK